MDNELKQIVVNEVNAYLSGQTTMRRLQKELTTKGVEICSLVRGNGRIKGFFKHQSKTETVNF